jgi:hypothetical protein
MPRPQLLVVAGIVAVALLLVVVALALQRGRPEVSGTGVVVIEALPWANVTAIRGADGTNHLASPTATPLAVPLPVGRYTVDLSSPSAPADKRTITVDVSVGQVTVAPRVRFSPMTSDEYFNTYFGGDSASSSSAAPDAAAPEGTPASPAGAAAPAGSQPGSPSGVTP